SGTDSPCSGRLRCRQNTMPRRDSRSPTPIKERPMVVASKQYCRLLIATAALFLFLSPAPGLSADERGWVNLFNGKDLDGWVQHGGKAKYRVEDGQIVGSSVPGTANSFLCTKLNYSDFVLELEFKVDPSLNSGVQIRSECFEEPKTVELN